jgi:hypothetical protein
MQGARILLNEGKDVMTCTFWGEVLSHILASIYCICKGSSVFLHRPTGLNRLVILWLWSAFGFPITLWNSQLVQGVYATDVSFWLTLSLLMSYIYGVPCKARNFNVVYIYIYMNLRLATLKAVSFYLLHNVSTMNQCRKLSCGTTVYKILQATKVTLITDWI